MKKRTINIILITVFIISLLPLYYIGGYAHPSVDDYYYGVETSQVWQNTHSVSAVISEAFELTKTTYNEWQGNFAAIFLMRLQPGIFAEQYYVIAPIILITAFAVSMLLFFYVLLRRWFGAGRTAALVTSVAVTFTAMQFTYVPSDSFYWYNGGIYYTFFFSLMLFLFTLVTMLIKSGRAPIKAVCAITALPLAFLIGGGNYATALFTSIILVLLTAYHIYKKQRVSIPLALIAIVSLAALGISVAAPGNAVRQASVGGSTGIIKALAYSFAYGGYNIASASTVPVIIMWIGLLPVFSRIAAKSGFKFRHPVIILIFTFCIYCAQGTPVFYAQGLRMPYRMMNIIYFAYYGFMTINLIYIMGWLHSRFADNGVVRLLSDFYENSKRRLAGFAVILICFAVGCVGLITVNEAEDGGVSFDGLVLSLDAAYSIADGSAAGYDAELSQRADYLSSSTDPNAILPPLSVTPSPIFHTDITADAGNWKNAHLALYYNKTSVRLSE